MSQRVACSFITWIKFRSGADTEQLTFQEEDDICFTTFSKFEFTLVTCRVKHNSLIANKELSSMRTEVEKFVPFLKGGFVLVEHYEIHFSYTQFTHFWCWRVRSCFGDYLPAKNKINMVSFERPHMFTKGILMVALIPEGWPPFCVPIFECSFT